MSNVPIDAKECLEKLFDEYQESIVENEELSTSLLEVMKNFAQDIYTVSLSHYLSIYLKPNSNLYKDITSGESQSR